MTDKVAEKIPSPWTTWKNRFREDFRFSPSGWLSGITGSFGSVLYSIPARLPARLKHLGRHLTIGLVEVFRQPQPPESGSEKRAGKQDSPGRRIGYWFLFLLFRLLDLFSFGEILNFITQVFKVNTRGLSEIELEEARRVFGDSLEYWRIRLDEWSLIAHFGAWSYNRRWKKKTDHMAMTIYNTVHFSRRIDTSPGSRDMAWLIHELTHVAQYQHAGGVFMMESLIAQGAEGYDYGGPAALFRRDLRDFNREQQGDIVKHYYQSLYGKKVVSIAEKGEYERMIGQLREGEL